MEEFKYDIFLGKLQDGSYSDTEIIKFFSDNPEICKRIFDDGDPKYCKNIVWNFGTVNQVHNIIHDYKKRLASIGDDEFKNDEFKVGGEEEEGEEDRVEIVEMEEEEEGEEEEKDDMVEALPLLFVYKLRIDIQPSSFIMMHQIYPNLKDLFFLCQDCKEDELSFDEYLYNVRIWMFNNNEDIEELKQVYDKGCRCFKCFSKFLKECMSCTTCGKELKKSTEGKMTRCNTCYGVYFCGTKCHKKFQHLSTKMMRKKKSTIAKLSKSKDGFEGLVARHTLRCTKRRYKVAKDYFKGQLAKFEEEISNFKAETQKRCEAIESIEREQKSLSIFKLLCILRNTTEEVVVTSMQRQEKKTELHRILSDEKCLMCLQDFTEIDSNKIFKSPMCHHYCHGHCKEKFEKEQGNATLAKCLLCEQVRKNEAKLATTKKIEEENTILQVEQEQEVELVEFSYGQLYGKIVKIKGDIVKIVKITQDKVICEIPLRSIKSLNILLYARVMNGFKVICLPWTV